MNDVAKLVCFGMGGDTVYIDKNTTCEGYGSPERPHAAQPREGRIFPDGTPIIDKRSAIGTPEGYRWVFDGPMVNVDLPDDEIEECPIPSQLFAQAVAGNAFGGLLAQHLAARSRKQRSGLDRVSIREYVDGWRKHGARIGHYEGNRIVWND